MTEQKIPVQMRTPEVELNSVRERALLYGSFVAAILGSVLFIVQIINTLQNGNFIQLIPTAIAYLVIFVLTFFRNINLGFRLYGLVAVTGIIGITHLIRFGILGDASLYLLVAVFLLALLSQRILAIIVGGFETLVMIGIGVTILLGIIPLQASTSLNRGTTVDWVLGILTFVLFSAIVIIVTDEINRRFISSLSNETRLTNDLATERATRIETLQRETVELSKRNTQKDLTNQIARDIASLTDLPSLLVTTVDLIRDRFGFYHTGIFLLDSAKEYAVLGAATGEVGKRMLEQKHRLRAGQEGIVGHVVSTGQARIALDVGTDAIHFHNPLLPETRSEMALPLKVGETIIGALDIQSQQESAFVPEDVDILQTIADQLAVGIERTRLMEQLQSTVKNLSLVSESITGQSWRQYLQKANAVFSISTGAEGEQKNIPPSPSVLDVIRTGSSAEKVIKESGTDKLSLTLPINLRGQAIGAMVIHFTSREVDPGLKEFFATISERLATSLENARKAEETQSRAGSDHLVREITTKVQSYTSVDDILKSAAFELGRSLGLSEVNVGLVTPEDKTIEG